MQNLGDLLLGAGLVTIGVLVAAAADRIRGLRIVGPAVARPSRVDATRVTTTTATPSREVPTTTALEMMQPDVVAALIGAGYRRVVAARAVDACTSRDRTTLESWTAAALRAAAQGGAS